MPPMQTKTTLGTIRSSVHKEITYVPNVKLAVGSSLPLLLYVIATASKRGLFSFMRSLAVDDPVVDHYRDFGGGIEFEADPRRRTEGLGV